MEHYTAMFMSIISIIGTIDTIVLIILLILSFISWLNGVSPALIRLGNGLAKRKIAIFAKGDNVGSLRSLLLDSKLFKDKNIREIRKVEDIGKAEETSVYLVWWKDWNENIADILAQKPDSCALIVYAPYEEGRIPDNQMKNLDGKRHTAVTNFRGRLLNDVVTSMITTSYEKR